MEKLKETLWYQEFDWSMIWVCLAAVLVHVLYLDINRNTKVKLTVKHYLFYLLSSLLVLTFISEVGVKFFNYFYQIPVELEGSIDHFLAAISGLGGGYITTRLIKLFQKSE